MVLYCCGKSLASKFKLLTVMIATTTKKKKRKRKKKGSMVTVLIEICFSTLQNGIEAKSPKPTQPIVKLALFMIFIIYLFFCFILEKLFMKF